MQITVRVLAAADPSMRNVFSSLEQAAGRAYTKTSTSARRSARESSEAVKAGLRDQAAAQNAGYRSSARNYEQDTAAQARSEAQKTRNAQREERIRSAIRDNTFRRIQSDEAAFERQRRQSARDFGRGVVSGGARAARAVMGGVGEAARGAGINFDVGSLVQNHLRLEETVTKATNQGAMAKGKAATPGQIADSMKAVRAAATANNIAFVDAAAGFDTFLGKFSDLDVAKGVLDDLLKISNATGASVTDLGDSAGAIAANIDEGDPVKKLKMVQDAMRLVTVMTTRGTVEMKDLAMYMPRLAAAANKFGGDYQKNLGELSTVAQMAMKGGRSTSAEATNTAQALPRDLAKAPMLKRLKEAGIDPFVGGIGGLVGRGTNLMQGKTGAENLEMRSLSDIIGDVYDKTGGDQAKIANLFRNETSKAGISSFGDIYKNEGRAGIDRVFKEMASMGDPGMIDAAAENTRNTKAGRARGLANQMQDSAGKGIDWAVNNPKEAIAVMGASIAGGGLLGGLMGGGGGGVLGGLFGGGGAGAGGLGGGGGGPVPVQVVAIAAAAAAAWFAGKAVIDDSVATKEKKEADDIRNLNDIQEIRTAGKVATTPGGKQAAIDALQKKHEENNAKLGALGPTNSLGYYKDDESFREAMRLKDEEQAIIAGKQTIRMSAGETGEKRPVDTWMGMALGGGTKGLSDEPRGGSEQKTDVNVASKLDALTAAIKGGIRVNNLSEIATPAPGATAPAGSPGRTGNVN